VNIAMTASQRLFFDSDAILKELSAAERKVNSRFGSFVMTGARRSMREVGKDGKPSPPGKPPKARKGKRGGLLKRGPFAVQFAWDTARRTTVVGPLVIPGGKDRNPGGTMPEALEHPGGKVIVKEAQKKDGTYSVRAAAWAHINGGKIRERVASVKARPFMQPSLDKEAPKFPGLWRNAITK